MVGYGRKHILKMFYSERLEICNDSTVIFSRKFTNSTKDRNFQCHSRFALYYWRTIYKMVVNGMRSWRKKHFNCFNLSRIAIL